MHSTPRPNNPVETQRTLTCLVCDEAASEIVNLNASYIGFRCASCGLIMTDVGQDHDRDSINAANYSNIQARIRTYTLREREFSRRYEWIYRTFKLKSYHSILEVGSNLGYFSNFLKSKGHTVYSSELNLASRETQRLLFGLSTTADPFSLEHGSIDLVVFMDVIEHIPEPLAYLERLKPILTPRGAVYLQFPNSRSLVAALAKGRWGWWAAPDHLFHFSKGAATAFLERAGFQVTVAKRFSPVLDDLSQLMARATTPFWAINTHHPLNRIVEFSGGSLLGLLGELK